MACMPGKEASAGLDGKQTKLHTKSACVLSHKPHHIGTTFMSSFGASGKTGSASEPSTWGKAAHTAALGQALQQGARQEIQGSNFHFAGFARCLKSFI